MARMHIKMRQGVPAERMLAKASTSAAGREAIILGCGSPGGTSECPDLLMIRERRTASGPCFGQRKAAVEARAKATARSDVARPPGYHWSPSRQRSDRHRPNTRTPEHPNTRQFAGHLSPSRPPSPSPSRRPAPMILRYVGSSGPLRDPRSGVARRRDRRSSGARLRGGRSLGCISQSASADAPRGRRRSTGRAEMGGSRPRRRSRASVRSVRRAGMCGPSSRPLWLSPVARCVCWRRPASCSQAGFLTTRSATPRHRLDRTRAPWQRRWRRGQGAGHRHRQPLGAAAS